MLDLKAQLGDYLDHAVQRVELEDILEERFGHEPVRPIHPRVPSRLTPGWVYAVAVAAVVLLLVGGAALLFPMTGPNGPVADTVPTTLTEATPTSLDESVPTTLPDPLTDLSSSFAWSQVPNDDDVFGASGGQEMLSATAGGPGFVAVGSDGNEGADYRAPVWTSPDGNTWSRIPHDPDVFTTEPDAVLWGVTAGGPGVVAVGSAEGHVTAVWTSVDGVTWSRVPHDDAVFPPGWIKSVTAGGPGLVAVGAAENDGAAVWTSADGLTWSRVPHDPAVFGDGGQLSMNSITAGGPGLVAVGEEESGGGWVYAAVWTSVDGITWSRVPNDDGVFGQSGVQTMSDVTAGPSGLVAVGSEESAEVRTFAAVWISPDGITWSRVPQSDALSRLGVMNSVITSPYGFVAVGAAWGSTPAAKVWTSPDGVSWSRITPAPPSFGVAEMTGVAAAGSKVVAVGAERPPGSVMDLDAAVWVAGRDD